MKLMSFLVASLMSLEGLGCSIFMQPETGMVAKNFDWDMAQGELIIRPVGAKKKALASDKSWVSRYGSVTFNQFGPDLPAGGMNTEGLMMEALILGSTQHPSLSSTEANEALNESEFIQYNLDQFKDVDEVLSHLSKIKIRKVHLPIHYFTCDESRKCAVIEFIKGKTIVHSDSGLVPPILTNLPYANVLASYEASAPASSEGFASYPRFKTLVDFDLNGNYSKMAMLKKLNSVKIKGLTVWQILYALKSKTIDLLHMYSSRPVSVNLNKLDFSCHSSIKVLSFKDQDLFFSEKNLKPTLFKRLEGLSKLDASLKVALMGRELENDCAELGPSDRIQRSHFNSF